jgi:hypothetical protein
MARVAKQATTMAARRKRERGLGEVRTPGPGAGGVRGWMVVGSAMAVVSTWAMKR